MNFDPYKIKSMKICIVTVYNSINCGSYLQATTLRDFFKEKGHEVSFLNTGARGKKSEIVFSVFKRLLTGQFKLAFNLVKSILNFKKYHHSLKTCTNSELDISTQDLIVLGSDEIWNISRVKAFARFPIFWGIGIEHDNIMSYAPSMNNTSLDQLNNYPYAKEGISKIKYLSVRDKHTKEMIKAISNREGTIVVDPTMLFTADHYNKIKGTCPFFDFILVYSFGGHMTKEDKKKIKEVAVMLNKKLVFFGRHESWVDISVPADPYDFLAYFEQADFIFTDTFHGTIFSLLFNKNFISFGEKKKKVVELLSYFDLDERIIKGSTDIDELIFNEIDYSIINPKIKTLRQKSYAFLSHVLSEVQEQKMRKM